MAESDEIERIIKEKFLSKFCDKYIYVGKDNTCLGRYYEKHAESFKNFEIKDDDVFVATYPKAGTTWAQEMVWMIGNNTDFEKGQQNINERFPFLDMCTMSDFKDEVDIPPCIKDSLEFTRQLPSPRYIKTHLPFSLLPEQIQNGTKRPKIIYVIRNPKDVCVSYFHHCRLVEAVTANLDEFVKVFLAGKEMYGTFWDHIFGYWDRRDWSNILIIKYEDMKNDIKSVIRTVSSFLEKDINEDQIERLTKHLSFESMKKNPSINYDQIIENRRKVGVTKEEGSFFRSGTVGQYKEELSKGMIEKFDKWIRAHTSGTSFEGEYDYNL